jgi:protein-disulfide isomerase
MKSYSPDNVIIKQAIPVAVGKETYYAIKAILTPAVKNQKEGKLTMLVDHTGTFQFPGVMNIADGNSPAELAMAEVNKIKLPENFGSVIGKGSGSHDVTIVSDPVCPYCRAAWSFIVKQQDKYKDFSLVHMPLSYHVGADAACWILAYVEDTYPDKIFEVANWAYAEFEAPHEKNLEKSREKVIKAFLEKYPWLTNSKPDEFKYFLKGKYEGKISDEIKKAQEIKISGTPAIFIDGIRIDGFDQHKIEKTLSM